MKRTPEELLEKLDALLDEYEGAVDKYDRGQFSEKYGERLGAYSDKLKALNGDDFDIISSAYDEHKKDYSELSDDDYVNALEANIKKVISRVWPEAPQEEVEAIAEEAVAETEEPSAETSVTVETSDPEVAESVEDVVEETPSDESLKRTTGPWKSPSKSGGRDGHCGLPGTIKSKDTTTSDEETKVEPEPEVIVEDKPGEQYSEEEMAKIKSDEACKKAAKATPNPVDDVVVAVANAKPEDVSPEPEVEAEDRPGEQYSDDEMAQFMKDLEKYKGHSAYNFR